MALLHTRECGYRVCPGSLTAMRNGNPLCVLEALRRGGRALTRRGVNQRECGTGSTCTTGQMLLAIGALVIASFNLCIESFL